MDKIFLHGMKADTLIGVYDWEREQMQTLLLDLDIGVAEQSAASDHIDDTIHYGDVCEAVRQSLREQSFLLLEALAEHIANASDQQSLAGQEVARNMEVISSLSEENQSQLQQLWQSMDALRGSAKDIEESIEVFRLFRR